MRNDISLELAKQLTEQVREAFEDGSMLDAVTPVTQDLLKYWFMEPYTEEQTVLKGYPTVVRLQDLQGPFLHGLYAICFCHVNINPFL